MRIPQPLTIAGAAILGFYAGSLGVAFGIARVLLTDRHGARCGQAH